MTGEVGVECPKCGNLYRTPLPRPHKGTWLNPCPVCMLRRELRRMGVEVEEE